MIGWRPVGCRWFSVATQQPFSMPKHYQPQREDIVMQATKAAKASREVREIRRAAMTHQVAAGPDFGWQR